MNELVISEKRKKFTTMQRITLPNEEVWKMFLHHCIEKHVKIGEELGNIIAKEVLAVEYEIRRHKL